MSYIIDPTKTMEKMGNAIKRLDRELSALKFRRNDIMGEDPILEEELDVTIAAKMWRRREYAETYNKASALYFCEREAV